MLVGLTPETGRKEFRLPERGSVDVVDVGTARVLLDPARVLGTVVGVRLATLETPESKPLVVGVKTEDERLDAWVDVAPLDDVGSVDDRMLCDRLGDRLRIVKIPKSWVAELETGFDPANDDGSEEADVVRLEVRLVCRRLADGTRDDEALLIEAAELLPRKEPVNEAKDVGRAEVALFLDVAISCQHEESSSLEKAYLIHIPR
jgi:hypothetical protein